MKREKLFLLNATHFDERVMLSCNKYANLNVYPNILSPESSFFKKDTQQSTIRINYKPNKKETKYSFLEQIFKQGRYFDETNKKPGNYCK